MSDDPSGKVTQATWMRGWTDVTGSEGVAGKSYLDQSIVKTGSFDLSPQLSGTNAGKIVLNMTSIEISNLIDEDGLVLAFQTLTLKGNASLIIDANNNSTYTGAITSLILNNGLGNTRTWTGNVAYSEAVENAIFNYSDNGDNLFDVISASSILGGNDTLNGANGNDTLIGGNGNDTLTGGSGADKFLFDTALNASTNLDTIKDFVKGTDKIVLDDDIFTAFAGKTAITSSQFTVVSSTGALSGNGLLTYCTANDTLYYDSNGSGTGDVAFAKIELTGTASPTFTDFTVIA
jgi:Ca2+-binding RTX toxin-like protein